MKKLDKCDLCKSDSASFLSLYKREIRYDQPWNTFIENSELPTEIEGCICLNCGWVFKNPSYTDLQLNKLYNYSPESIISDEAISQAKLNSEIRSIAYKQYLYEKTHIEFKNILDVGGRNGEIMSAFLDNDSVISVLDMDAGASIDERINKIRVPFLDYISNLKYDLVTMFHILEHTDSPSTFLSHAYKLLNDSGYIYIEVPLELITQMIFKHIGDHRHLGYFSRNSMELFLNNNGFTCVSCEIVKGLVGGDLAVIRAIGKKSQLSTFKKNKWRFLYTILDLFHLLPVYIRIKNELK